MITRGLTNRGLIIRGMGLLGAFIDHIKAGSRYLVHVYRELRLIKVKKEPGGTSC